jgi:REP element-mobilizing transposase RayT
MGRRLRLHLPGGFYNVTLRGNHRENIFTVENDRLLLNSIVQHALEKHDARIHAYCWMTNHIHLLIQVGAEPLAAVMRRIASGYARSFQRNRETTGHLFQNRYHSLLVDADSYFLELIRYMHLNPVRAGMVKSPCDYRWSSHHAYCGAPTDEWVTTSFGLRILHEDRVRAMAAYRRFVDCDVNSLSSPFEHVRLDRPEILGGDAFVERICGQLNVPMPRQSFDALVDEGCRRFDLTRLQLGSGSRNERIASLRAWVARRAVKEGIANVEEAARQLGCDSKTLRRAMQRYPVDADVSGEPSPLSLT